jgi:PAS domain S-box-containing protein
LEILLYTSDEAVANAVADSLRGLGHSLSRCQGDLTIERSVGLAIIDGLDGVVEAHAASCDILALVEEDEVRLFPECPREITDFVVKPLRPAELGARIALIVSRPPYRERLQHALLSLAVETAGDIIEVTAPDGVLEYVNPAYEHILGVSPREAIGGEGVRLVGSDQESPELLQDIEAALARGETWQGVLVTRARDGRHVQLDSTITTVLGPKGQVTHHLAVKRDISERLARQEALMEANRALSEARDVAVAASRAKSEFLANMSHELRTPLNAIIGYSEMLLEDLSEDAQVAKDLGRIRSAGTHLLALINDVLDISKIEAQKAELFPEWFELSELVEQVGATIQPMADKNGNRFVVELGRDLGSMHADRVRMRQVLLNLLSNACKFTKHGTVELSVRVFERAGSPWLEFVVRDTGIGISAEQQAKLFQPFAQADSSTTREYGGTGLGLAICKRLAEMMGGEIALDSALGRGTVMYLRVPQVREGHALPQGGETAQDSQSPELRGTGPMVLLIDDDPAVRDLFARQLVKRGFKPRVAASGQEGIAAAGRLKPDAIVLDVKMPGLSGWEVLSALKLSDATAHIPVIMLTVMQQSAIGQALGAVDYLIKPIQPSTLTATLRRHTGMPAPRVLVVEDDEPTRELVRRTLESEGSTVIEADNGEVALARLRESEPDIVLLDLMMPVMDGFSFLQHLRADPRYARLPVVVATARQLSPEERSDLERTVQRVIEKSAHSRGELLEAIAHEIHRMLADPADHA